MGILETVIGILKGLFKLVLAYNLLLFVLFLLWLMGVGTVGIAVIIMIVLEAVGIILLVIGAIFLGPGLAGMLGVAAETVGELGAAGALSGAGHAPPSGAAHAATPAAAPASALRAAGPSGTNVLKLLGLAAIVIGICYAFLPALGFSIVTTFGIGLSLTVLLLLYVVAPNIGQPLAAIAFVLGGESAVFFFAARFSIHPFITALALGFTIFIGYVYLKAEKRSAGIIAFILLANMLFFALFLTTDVAKTLVSPNSALGKGLLSMKTETASAWNTFWSALPSLLSQSQAQLSKQIDIASGDAGYESGVQAQSTKQLGVFLDNLGLTSNQVPKTGVVDLFARLRAESFTLTSNAEPLTIKLKCYDDQNPSKTGALRPQDEFTIEEYENTDIDCLFDAKDLTVGANTLDLEATFDFATSAYLKTYFMDQETIRSYRRQQQDPLTEFQIADKDPSAVYTAGPMRIGMKAGQQPVALVLNRDDGPTLTLTIERAWLDGQLVALKEISITAPPGLALDTINGQPLGAACSSSSTQEQTCTLGPDLISKLYQDLKKDLSAPFITMRITTKARDPNKLLGGAPLGIRSFKTNIKYTYQIKKQQTVTITETTP